MRPLFITGALVLLMSSTLSLAIEPERDTTGRVTWDPLARPVRESDTLFLPDLSSPQSIEDSGGFLHGHHNEALEELRSLFEFGQGRFGYAVRVRAEDVQHYWVWFPLDGLIPADEFTLEFWAKSDRSWKEEDGATFFHLNSGENEIAFRIHQGQLLFSARWPGSKDQWSDRLDEVRLEPARWHAFALSLRERTLSILIDGKTRGTIEDVRFHPLWSDGAKGGQGIQLGGAPWRSSNVWISDLRISRTARAPGRPVRLRTLESRIRFDASRTVGSIPPPHVGSLHPGQKSWPPSRYPGATPEQIYSALEVVRTDKFLQATPIKRGEPDDEHRSPGRSGQFSYDWQVVDRTLDWFKTHRVKPYLSLTATPSILGGSVQPFEGEKLRTALSRSAGFGPEMPNDLDAWAAIVEDFVHHVLREHRTEVPWWGVWNEPDQPGFWKGGVKEYLGLYEVTVRAVKKVDPRATIGGPESGLNGPWIESLIRHCSAKGLPLDFISYHDYSGDLNTLEAARQKVDRVTESAGLTTPMPIVVGEFNWSAGNLYKPGWPRFHRDFWHVRAFGAAYTTAYLTRMMELPAFELMIWSHTHYGDPRAGGWAATQLIGSKGQQWAPYNALKGWKKVTGDRVLFAKKQLAPAVFAVATIDSRSGDVGITLVNYGFAQRQCRPATIELTGIEEGSWRLTRWSVDPAHSSRWDVAQDRCEGAPHDDLKMIEHRNVQVIAGRPLTLQLDLPVWSSTFVKIEPQ